MKEDYQFALKILNSKKNTIIHYPALKNIIKLINKKWIIKKGTPMYSRYSNSLRMTLIKNFKKTNIKSTI